MEAATRNLERARGNRRFPLFLRDEHLKERRKLFEFGRRNPHCFSMRLNNSRIVVYERGIETDFGGENVKS